MAKLLKPPRKPHPNSKALFNPSFNYPKTAEEKERERMDAEMKARVKAIAAKDRW